MARRDTGTDDARVRVRANRRGTRPRTKQRPEHADAVDGFVVGVDRGRYQVLLTPDERGADAVHATHVVAMKARELGRATAPDPVTGELPPRTIVVGDRVGLVGDVSGRTDTLARIVRVHPRRTVLRRTAEDSEAQGVERVIVANADQLGVVTALTDPPPRPRMIDRCLVAAFDAGLDPLLVLTKSDLTSPDALLARYEGLDVPSVVTSVVTSVAPAAGAEGAGDDGGDGNDDAAPAITGLDELRALLTGRITVLVGHSGVGKSTLVNALIPDADRAVGVVNAVTGRGRHTSTSAVALPLPGGGWIVDTPGVRTFGLAHVEPDSLLRAFTDLWDVATAPEPDGCPRGCDHAADTLECALDDWALGRESYAPDGPLEPAGDAGRARLASFRRLLAAREGGDGGPEERGEADET